MECICELARHGWRRNIAINPVPIGGHTLPPLPYAYNALEPYISEEIMRLHHDKHHQSYVDGLNKAEKNAKSTIIGMIMTLLSIGRGKPHFMELAIICTLFFGRVMSPGGGGEPSGELASAN